MKTIKERNKLKHPSKKLSIYKYNEKTMKDLF